MPTRIPSYRYHKASKQAVVVLGGRSFYLGPWNSPESRVEYDRLVSKWLTDRRRRTIGAPRTGGKPSDISINELILAFLEHADVHYRDREGKLTRHIGNLKDALRPVRTLYGHTLAEDFGPLALRTVRETMIQAKLCRRTINDRIHRIRRCFRWAASVELIPVTLVQALDTVSALQAGRSDAPESPGISSVAMSDVEATFAHLPAVIIAMIRLQLLCGCRAGEVVQIRGIDLEMSDPVWIFRPKSHKNSWRGEERTIFLGPRAQEIIQVFLKDDPGEFLFSPKDRVDTLRESRAARRTTRRTPSELKRQKKSQPKRAPGERYTTNSYRQAIVRACLKAGINEWSPLQLRHSAATAIRKEFGVEGAQLILGHQKADVTQLYAERDLAKAKEIAVRFG